jgi:hypothetical protein
MDLSAQQTWRKLNDDVYRARRYNRFRQVPAASAARITSPVSCICVTWFTSTLRRRRRAPFRAFGRLRRGSSPRRPRAKRGQAKRAPGGLAFHRKSFEPYGGRWRPFCLSAAGSPYPAGSRGLCTAPCGLGGAGRVRLRAMPVPAAPGRPAGVAPGSPALWDGRPAEFPVGRARAVTKQS